jgi:hypothetical protein
MQELGYLSWRLASSRARNKIYDITIEYSSINNVFSSCLTNNTFQIGIEVPTGALQKTKLIFHIKIICYHHSIFVGNNKNWPKTPWAGNLKLEL